MLRVIEVIAIISLLLRAAPAVAGDVTAQGGPRVCIWSQPVNISETPEFYTYKGTLVGDPFGYVHAFWGEKASESNNPEVLGYIIYRYWDGSVWSPPADILVAKSSSSITPNKALTSRDGSRLSIGWVDASGFYVSWADRIKATDARAWHTTQVVEGGPPRPALTSDDQDILHALYADPFTGDSIGYRQSIDGGETWSEPTTVWVLTLPDKSLANTSLFAAGDGTLHAAWQVNGGTRGSSDTSSLTIMYARSTDNGTTWAAPLWEFNARETSYGDPTIFEDHSSRLHLVWNGAAGMPGGRFYSWSDDGGISWAPVQELPGDFLGGRSGFPQIVEDSSGTLHVFHCVQMSSLGARGRYVSAYLTDHEWSSPVEVPGADCADEPALGISGGNQLFALLWAEPADVFYSTCLLNAPAITPLPTPVVSLLAVNPAQAVASPTPSAPSATVQPRDAKINLDAAGDGPTGSTDQAVPILVGALSAALVVAVGVAFARGSTERR